MARARSGRRRALLRNAAVVVSGCRQNAPTLSHSGSFRTEILDSRSFDSRSFARTSAESRSFREKSKSRPITSESKSGKLSLPIRSRPSWPIKGRGHEEEERVRLDVRWGEGVRRARRPSRHISTRWRKAADGNPPNIKMACMSLSAGRGRRQIVAPRLSATARVTPRRVERCKAKVRGARACEESPRERRVRTPRTRDPKADLSPRRPSPLPPAEPVTEGPGPQGGCVLIRDFRERSPSRAWIPDREGPTGETRAWRTPRARVGDGVSCLAAPIAPHDLPSARSPAWPLRAWLDRPPRGRLSNRPRHHLLAHARAEEAARKPRTTL